MMMLDAAEQAKSKWCPFARVRALDNGSVNRFGLSSEDWPHCIADGCMAWRWANQPADETKHRGYCGLVSKENA
jgi:hypothetical protein